MEKKNFFSQLAQWPLINFDHAKIVVDGKKGMVDSWANLYVYDRNESEARLFIRHVAAGTDLESLTDIYNGWTKEYRKSLKSILNIRK
ncbi:hypothetical protein [Erwinia aphidicola]|uniref:hypothetical protein n=1 Tax=Erwinia aphidicola TaxID=68334 RepID=UPI003D1A6610